MTGTNGNHEYSPAELYKLAELLASDRQCAIAAAQQLLAQVNQNQEHPLPLSTISDKVNSILAKVNSSHS